jgi:hypothetical protein
VPWCEPCGRFYNPNTLRADGTCPKDHVVADPTAADTKVPWHFWMLLVALGIYLSWRLIQGVMWLAG